ncbi:MAG: hypothetical protein P4M09_29175 [Devosia sp.]|nr:hypothetical protein [Devosia sp.]
MTTSSAVLPTLSISTPMTAPRWALLERELFDVLNRAALEFADRYCHDDGTLIWRDRWPGMDGSDDPYEGFMNMPLLHALGGSRDVYQRSRKIWDAITWQWTQYGQIHNEFDAYYDWMHHGESSLFFYFFGLCDPHVPMDRQRAKRFAELYTGETPEAPNYDPERRLVRSPINGSRGPRFAQTEEDWVTHREILDNYLPPFEDLPGIDPYGYKTPWSDDAVYRAILDRMNARQAKGDVPLNLTASSMMAHAFMYLGDEKFRSWVLDYHAAWEERTARNGGLIPDNIGLSGEIGEYNDGKWWGGYYGWRWPHGSNTILEPLSVSGCNATLLTGDTSHLNLLRSQLDRLWSLGREEDGYWKVPNRHYDAGWRDFRHPHPMFGIYAWNLSMADEDAERAERGWAHEIFDKVTESYSSYGRKTAGGHMGFNGNTAQWFRFIRGGDPDYPETILRANLEMAARQLERFRTDEFDPATMDHYRESMTIHQWQQLTPVMVEALAQLTLGGPMHVYHGGLQIARLRYYDADARQPGLPRGVAALVDRLADDGAEVTLVNTDLFSSRHVVVQGGTFAEHEISWISAGRAQRQAVGRPWIEIELAPGAGARLTLGMRRFARAPSYDTPWKRAKDGPFPLHGRTASAAP